MRRRLLCAVTLALAVVACGDDDGARTATSVPAEDGADAVEAPEQAGQERPATEDPATDEPATDDPATDDPATEPGTSVPTDDPATAAPEDAAAHDEGRDEPLVFAADLAAAAAVPPPGDEGASGRVEIQAPDEGTACFDMVTTGLAGSVSAAHIHRGEAGTSGAVVVDIGLPTLTDGDTDTWRDVCVVVDPPLLDDLEAAPAAFYVNVHTETHPDSALRGQLQEASIFDLTLS